MFAGDSNQSLCHCVLLLGFNGKSYKLWLRLASRKGCLSGRLCRPYSCAGFHFTGCLSDFAGPSLRGRSALLLPASSSAIKGRRALRIPSGFGKVQLPSLLTSHEKGFASSPNLLACLFTEASAQPVWVMLPARAGPGP